MHIDDLLDERDRLLQQRAAILSAISEPAMNSDLDQDALDDLRISVEQALDDAFFPLLDPIDCDIEEYEAATAWRRQRADVIDLRSRR